MRQALRWFLWLGGFLCTAVFASNGADVRIERARIEWPLLRHSATLSIQGPDGEVRTMSLPAGQTPKLRLSDLGEADGSYSWELRDARGVESGSFTVSDGSFVTPEPEAARRGKVTSSDEVIPDDLIVQRSLCVGFDCTDGEDFGFNTLVLKENNLRIGVVDTSVPPYPGTDWTIAFNDSASGGGNRMTISDSSARTTPFGIEGEARSYSLWVDSTGRIGLGTSVPAKDVHLQRADTPTLRFEQLENTFAAHTWDLGANEAQFFVRDVTGGGTFPFRIRPGAPTSSIDVRGNGNVGLNCDSAASDLVIASGNGCSTPSSSLNSGDAQFTVASSRTFKENLAPVVVPDVLEKLLKIDVYRYDFISGPKDRLGLMAEDFHEIFARGSEKYIDGNEVQMALWLAVRKLAEEKAELAARVEALEAKLAERKTPPVVRRAASK